MVSIRAHFDGKVFVPDELVGLPPHTAVRLFVASDTDADGPAMEYLKPGLDQNAFSVGTLDDEDAASWWASRTPEERLAAGEFLRQVTYGYDPTARIPRILEFAELEGR